MLPYDICHSPATVDGLDIEENFMADPLLAMIGAITLGVLGIVAVVSIVVLAVQIGLALGRTVGNLFAKPNKS